ncbi:hypothetical protein NM688_g1196 [Phlebia brevispora]|uniref:Uncharacterized protein n=1 Tax=Phlebia brevispora TaxID=194682 RepID=A0ACC1TCF8_9APHY|nr:hypothetical protein NM688_g1196 [Phlebia brevispora]
MFWLWEADRKRPDYSAHQLHEHVAPEEPQSNMREILYIQAGKLANYVGTHFWNAQESYFTYGEGALDPIVNHDISFREGLSERGESTFSPRLLLFDRKSNFGSLSDLYDAAEAHGSEELLSEWNGDVVEYRQDPVPQSDYHARLDTERDTHGPEDEQATPRADESRIRFWADYSRVFFHPRTIQRLPDPPDWEAAEGDWAKGIEEFNRLEEDSEFMEETFRMFVEECDNLQGLQLVNETPTFGSFTHSFLTRFRDEFTKIPSLSLSILSGVDPRKIDVDDSPSLMKALNDALCLRSLSELSTMTVPLQNPSTWTAGPWLRDLTADLKDSYHASALLSTHIESATLPLRLKSPASSTDMSTLCSLLNWRENTSFASLSGAFPLSTSDNLEFEQDAYARIYDLSTLVEVPNSQSGEILPFARIDVSRGFSKGSISSYDTWAKRFQPPPFSIHAPACNIPTSFPRILVPVGSPQQTAGAFSSIVTSHHSSTLFAAFSSLADDCLRRHTDVVDKLGLERDDVRQLRDELQALEDIYKVDEGLEDVEMDEQY